MHVIMQADACYHAVSNESCTMLSQASLAPGSTACLKLNGWSHLPVIKVTRYDKSQASLTELSHTLISDAASHNELLLPKVPEQYVYVCSREYR